LKLLENTAPTVTITTPIDASTAVEGASVDLVATAWELEHGDLTADIAWVSDVDGALGTGGSVSLTALSVGPHLITASATDALSLSGTDQVTMTVVVNTAPTVTITSPIDASTAVEGASVDLVATATDLEHGDLTADIAWVSDVDGALGTGGSVSLTTLSAGAHLLTASATDALSLSGTDQVTMTVIVNTAPTVTITSPIDASTAVQGASVDLVATATDLEHGDLTADIAWTSDVDGALGTGGALSLTTLSVGAHLLTASATDALSLSGTDQVTMTVIVNTAPTVAITSPIDASTAVEGASVELVATARDREPGV
jgi:hypothetical protein